MIEIREMLTNDAEEVLAKTLYGHLACVQDGKPYVVPVHYSYRKPYLYIYTTEGKKSRIIRDNPNVCLQVEDVIDDGDWRSVLVDGIAERVDDRAEREEILSVVLVDNPLLSPAVSVKWSDSWIRENVEVIYRIKPETVTGRCAVHVETRAATVRGAGQRQII